MGKLFSELDIGDVFDYNDSLYVKLNFNTNGDDNALWICGGNTWEWCWIDEDSFVTPVKAVQVDYQAD